MPLGSNPLQPIRCCLAKGSRLWVGYWNRVHVVDMNSRKVEVRNRRSAHIVSCLVFKPVLELTIIVSHLISQQTFSVSERSEQQVRFLCAGGSGVWAACRLDPVLRLFDWSTGRPLQEVDLTALVTKMLGATAVLFVLSHFYLKYKNNTLTLGHGQRQLCNLRVSNDVSKHSWVKFIDTRSLIC